MTSNSIACPTGSCTVLHIISWSAGIVIVSTVRSMSECPALCQTICISWLSVSVMFAVRNSLLGPNITWYASSSCSSATLWQSLPDTARAATWRSCMAAQYSSVIVWSLRAFWKLLPDFLSASAIMAGVSFDICECALQYPWCWTFVRTLVTIDIL